LLTVAAGDREAEFFVEGTRGFQVLDGKAE